MYNGVESIVWIFLKYNKYGVLCREPTDGTLLLVIVTRMYIKHAVGWYHIYNIYLCGKPFSDDNPLHRTKSSYDAVLLSILEANWTWKWGIPCQAWVRAYTITTGTPANIP